MYYSTTQQGMRNFELVIRKLFYFYFSFLLLIPTPMIGKQIFTSCTLAQATL